MASRILVSALDASPEAAHGGPVITRRHAAALSRRGLKVHVAAPRGDPASPGAAFSAETYKTGASSLLFAARRPDAVGLAAFRRVIDAFRPDVVYDIHGPLCAVEAAFQARVPVVSMIGAYDWYCLQGFLVDSHLQRCSGPESAGKCFDCQNYNYSRRRRIPQSIAKPLAQRGMIRLALWDAVADSHAYMRRLREVVASYVVADRQAHEFLLANGIAPHKVVRIEQGLPQEALVPRRRAGEGEAIRDRPLRLGFVGRPHLDKGIHVLGRAFDSLAREVPVELWIVHSQLATPENLRRHFPSAARFDADLASGRIKLFRPSQRDAVFDLMARIDVGIIPSLAYESPSLAMMEFAAQGTPIVRSESRGMEHVIQEGVNGRTFPYGDAGALASILLAIAVEPSVIARWRSALPTIASDDEYAGRLASLFQQLRGPSVHASSNPRSRPQALPAP